MIVFSWMDHGTPCAVNYIRQKKEIYFEKEIPVHVECSYPCFTLKSVLAKHVNQQLKADAEACFDAFVREELFSDELSDDSCTLSYDLDVVYQKPDLISIFGCRVVCRDSHGCSYYEGQNFWYDGNKVVELTLDDLFLEESGHRPFLLQYCTDFFTRTGYGYYSSCKELLPELTTDDLDIFTLTRSELVITFRAYRVGGWADGPDQVFIPYTKIKQFINPDGPLGYLSE
jgi:hypothetical protein